MGKPLQEADCGLPLMDHLDDTLAFPPWAIVRSPLVLNKKADRHVPAQRLVP
jgi:hypothetical protein